MSVGHIARSLEEAGIPTVNILASPFAHRARGMRFPRAVITPQIMGRPLGRPGDAIGQREVILKALGLLESARENGSILEFQVG